MLTHIRGAFAPVLLRVAVVTRNYDSVADGAALALNRLVGFLGRSGVPAKVFAPAAGKPAFPHEGERFPVPSVRVSNSPYRFALGLPPSARRELRAFAPSVVHVCDPDWLGFSALRWACSRGVPVVANYRPLSAEFLKRRRLGFLEPLVRRARRWFYDRCHEVFVGSDSAVAELRREGVNAEPVVVPAGVDPAEFNQARRSAEWRRSVGIADDEAVVAFVGPLVWGTGLAVFADVLADLRTNGVKFRPLVVGDGPERERLRSRLPDAVFTGTLGGESLARAVASADLFLNSDPDAAGCGTLEAMAAGVTVVVADAGGSRDVVRDGVDGIVCPAGDRGSFGLVVRRLIENPTARANLRQAALRRAAGFGWDAILADVRANYERVVARANYTVREWNPR